MIKIGRFWYDFAETEPQKRRPSLLTALERVRDGKANSTDTAVVVEAGVDPVDMDAVRSKIEAEVFDRL